MTHSLERRIVLGFGAAIGVLLLVMSAAWWNAAQFSGTQYWVDRTRQLLAELEAARGAVLGMQASVRGFILTGSDEMLRPYEASVPRLEAALGRLRLLTADNPPQRERLRRLEALIERTRTIMSERVAVRRTGGLEAAADTTALIHGAGVMAGVNAVVREMIAEEEKLLDDRLVRSNLFGRLTVVAIITGGIMAVTLLILATIKVRRDLRRRREAEDERDRFFTVSRDLLCIVTPDGRFKRLNPAWEDVLGLPPEALLARPIFELVHPDDRERTRQETQRVLDGAESVDFENRYLAQDGSYRWLRWSARAAPGERLIYASARDVTERKETEDRIRSLNAELSQRAEQLEAANRELESFSYSVSHDLRAPLRHVDGFAGLLAKHVGDHADPELRRYVVTISRAAKRMGTLIDDLLAFSRIGRVTLRIEAVAHARLVEEVIRDGHYGEAGPPVTWDIAPLPDVRADAAMLRQVWANLLDNAVKYSSRNPQPRIAIGSRHSDDGSEHVFFVRDNGVGFDMAYAANLFGVFQRLHGPAEFEGTGIGLANVRRIVSRHGGHTWAEGRVGEGATFFFTLPVTPPLPRT